MPVRVIGFDHLVVRCSDVERSLAFYCESLGLLPERLEEWRRGEVPFPSVRITPTAIVDLVAEPPDGTNVDHICLVVDAATVDEVAAQFPDGIRRDGLFGAQGYASSVYVSDPDGNTVELRTYG